VTGRDPDRVEHAKELAGAAVGIAADLSKPEEAARLLAGAGAVECLVNNVGDAYQASFHDLTDEQWDSMWQLNVMSYVRCIRAVLPAMREAGGGVIVNVSSTAGKRPSTGMPNYSVTKAAVLSLSRLVADLYAKDGIRCNAVAPGPTATGAWLDEGGLADQQAARSNNTRLEVLDTVGKGRPLGRLAEPEEIASVICFLCSERSSYVTGAAWSADGGTVPIII
jgi:NAD(P)-dependent dehydrogenase (short-subunit alcohol dehydrogenase family)